MLVRGRVQGGGEYIIIYISYNNIINEMYLKKEKIQFLSTFY